MSNSFNDKLDKILNRCHGFEYIGGGLWRAIPAKDKLNPEEAKQLITSLIKELVAEAKPTNFRNAAMTTDETNWYGAGYNHALENFEQNLLKALEEV